MKRYHIIDEIRGITILSMILYHTIWDLVYIFGRDWQWYYTDIAYMWQQSICWSFILLSGFCFSLGKKKWKRGLMVLGAGTLVTIVTHLVMPEQRVRFGVLTLLGSSMLLMALLEKIIELFSKKKEWKPQKPLVGMALSFAVFFLTRGINEGYFGFENIRLYEMPDSFYHGGDFMTYIGFMDRDFFSTDYFSMIPWFFLFAFGYFFFHWVKKKGWLSKFPSLPALGKVFRFMGKNSLPIYLLHQPVIYGMLYLAM